MSSRTFLTILNCWTGSNRFEIGKGYVYEPTMLTQVMELDSNKNGHSYSQVMNLTEGKYELKMDYAPRHSKQPQESSFTIYFNGVEIANIRPDLYGVTTVLFTVLGRNGPNVLEFVDKGSVDNYGAAIDNVGIFAWKTNKLCIKEIMAVEAGYPVTPISFLN